MGKHIDALKRLFDQWQGGQNDNLETYLAALSEDIEYDHFLHPTLAQASPDCAPRHMGSAHMSRQPWSR